MNTAQAIIDGLIAQWQSERASSQMTLGKLIDRLKELPPETPIEISDPHSYRGYYCDLAFECCGGKIPAKDALALCQGAMGETFTGYKGGDFQMGRNTPVWRASYGCCGKRIMAIRDDGSLELGDSE